VTIPLSPRAVEVLKRVPEHPSGLFFPMTPSAVDNAWDNVREWAGRSDLQFRDLRHVGGTAYARRGLSAHQLRLMLGHKTLAQALVYVNLVAQDVLEVLARTEPDPSAATALPPAVQGSAQEEMNRRRAERLNGQRQGREGAAVDLAHSPGVEACEPVSADSARVTSGSDTLAASQASGQVPAGYRGENIILFPNRRVANG